MWYHVLNTIANNMNMKITTTITIGIIIIEGGTAYNIDQRQVAVVVKRIQTYVFKVTYERCFDVNILSG